MTVLIVVRLVQGAAGAAGIVVGRAVVADMFAGKVAAAYFSAIAAINGLAPILAPVIGGQVLRVGTWRTVFWVLAGIGVVMLLLAFFVIHETLPPERRSSGGMTGDLRAFGTLLRDRGYTGTVLAGTMVSAAMFGYISASPFLLQDGFGLSAQWFSACFALNALGIVAATQIGRMLLHRTTSFALLSWGVGQALVGAVLLLVTVLVGWGLAMVLVSLFVMVSSVGLALPHSSAIAMDRHRRIAGCRLGAVRPGAVRARRGHRPAGRVRGSDGRAGVGGDRGGGRADRGRGAAVARPIVEVPTGRRNTWRRRAGEPSCLVS